MEIRDKDETSLLDKQRLYLTVMASAHFEEAGLMKIEVRPGQEVRTVVWFGYLFEKVRSWLSCLSVFFLSFAAKAYALQKHLSVFASKSLFIYTNLNICQKLFSVFFSWNQTYFLWLVCQCMAWGKHVLWSLRDLTFHFQAICEGWISDNLNHNILVPLENGDHCICPVTHLVVAFEPDAVFYDDIVGRVYSSFLAQTI